MTIRKCFETLNDRGATAFLLLLVSADLAFMVLHVLNHAFPAYIGNPLLNINKDRTYPELYQYVKFFWVIILLIDISIRRRSLQYVAWVLVFTYFLSDDSLRIHEQVGRHISLDFNFTPPFGLKLNDVGELVVAATAGMILLPFLIWAYWSGSQPFRKVSQDIALLILILVFFGVVVDVLHMVIKLGWIVSFALGLVEDGGEMLATSLILWYVYLLMLRGDVSDCYLCDLVRNVDIK